MEIKLTNFGKIKEANIQLNGLTLIAGLNDTGKSTVGKCLFALIKSINNYPKMYEQIRMEYFYKEHLISLKMAFRDLHSNFFGKSQALNLSKNKLFERFLFSFGFEKLTEKEIKLILKEIIMFCRQNNYKSTDAVERKALEAEKYLNVIYSNNQKITEICKRIFSDLFIGTINNSLHQEDETSVLYDTILEMKIKNNNIAIIGNPKLDLRFFNDAIFIDNPIILDDNYIIQDISNSNDFFKYEMIFDNSVSFTKDAKIKIAEAKKRLSKENYYSNLLYAFDDIFDKAKFKYNNLKNKLEYTVTDTAQPLSISNIAMGSKSFGLLYILLKSGVLQKDSLIILDEPENHLHPEWQIKYAEIICKMVADGFYVLLTSHSPYFIQALRKYSQKENILDSKTNFYFAEKTNEENYSIISNVKDKVGNINTEKIFKSLYKPFETLDNE